jgi:D-threonate/D-erythronate kinase
MIAIVADDLTGASDAAVQFARRGLATRVVFALSETCVISDVEALAVDTDTRALPADSAYTRVRDVADRLRAIQPQHVYKKVDSTLRGNLGAEIDAVMDAFGYSLAIVAPAFPALGRTTRYGLHHLRGVPVHETEVSRDPRAPVGESRLVALLQSQSRRTPGLVPLTTVERGPRAIRQQVEAHARGGASLVVCDAETDAALGAIAASCADRRDILWVGSAGLAEHMADVVDLPLRPPRVAEPGERGGPILLVAGSVSEITRLQVDALRARPGVVLVEVDPAARPREIERCRQAVGAALSGGLDCALLVARQTARVEAASLIAEALGSLAADCARSYPLRGLILTGGDTARAVCRHLGVSGIQLVGEVEPGLPLGWLVGQNLPRLLAVTKAGAFGSQQTLVHAVAELKGGG